VTGPLMMPGSLRRVSLTPCVHSARLGALSGAADAVTHPLTHLNSPTIVADEFGDVDEDIGPAVVAGDEPETQITVEPIQYPELDRNRRPAGPLDGAAGGGHQVGFRRWTCGGRARVRPSKPMHTG
jgi:hypothetical protein